jgi:serine/threonine protein phosphatase PrpC
MVTCPACGGTSRDREFCDHCNADLMPPDVSLPPAVCPVTPETPLQFTPEQLRILAHPEAAVTVRAGRKAWRIHWIPRPYLAAHRASLEDRARCTLDVLAPCWALPDREGAWLLAELAPPQQPPWIAPPAREPIEEVRRLSNALEPLAAALGKLHAEGLVWLTFDPRELEFLPGDVPGTFPQVRFTNLDLAVYPQGRCPERLHFNAKFAAPEVCRFRAPDVGPATDTFHLAAFAYYWLARLLPGGFFGAGLEAFGFAIPPLRTFAPSLPPGIAPVLARGLAVEPARRFPTPAVLCAELRAALERAERRENSTTPVQWDIGVNTRPGKAKTALGRANEDYALVRPFSPAAKTLLAVADGISSCDVGNGELASRMACEELARALGPQCSLDSFPLAVTMACRAAARTLIDWAEREGHRQRLLDGDDLMGTTLVAAWLEGNRLALANLGDSRAYLLDETGIEQLTVDGDLGSALLSAGVPPEDVREAGSMAKALRDCVGGYTRTPSGELKVQEQHCTPTVTFWRLVPGDVVVLCTDGLVEEGIFLDPQTLAELVGRHKDLTAQAQAVKLADAAEALQRPPTPHEPEGFGDNISCVVIKVLGS